MKYKQLLHSYTVIFLGITLLLLVVFSLSPEIAGTVYRKGIFQLVRVARDYTLGFLPIPWIYILLIALPILWILSIAREKGWRLKLVRSGQWLIWMVCLFFWLWGFNYTCPPIVQDDYTFQLSDEALFDLGRKTVLSANEHRSHLNNPVYSAPVIADDVLRQHVESVLPESLFPTLGRGECKVLSDRGFIRRMGIGGIYIPYIGEGITTDTYLQLSSVYIRAHEMAHVYGVCGEGEADLIAYLAMKNAVDDHFLQYAGDIELLRTVLSRLRGVNDSLSLQLRNEIPWTIRNDLRAIRRNHLLYTEIVPGMGAAVNDTYLRTMRVQGGVLNYDRFPELLIQMSLVRKGQ